MLEGAFVAIVTPFKNNNIDEEALRNLVEFQIKEGTNGIVPCGTTGESATLTYDEHCKVIDIVIDQAKKGYLSLQEQVQTALTRQSILQNMLKKPVLMRH